MTLVPNETEQALNRQYDVYAAAREEYRKKIEELAAENEALLAANRDVMLHWDVLKADYERLREALRESADELDAYYRAEYPGDHPYSQKKLQQAMATNPARAALEEKQ